MIDRFENYQQMVLSVEASIPLEKTTDRNILIGDRSKSVYLIRDITSKNRFLEPINSELSLSFSFKDQLSILTYAVLRLIKRII